MGGELRVGMVSDDAEARVATGGPPPVEQAFRALDLGAQPQPLPAVPERGEELDALGLLIVDDVPGFTPAQRRELAQWVEKGGVLLLTFGPRAAAAPIGMGFAPMLPGIVRWRKGAPGGIDPDKDRIFGEASDGLDALEAKGRAQLDIERPEGLRELVYWQDGAPFLVEHRMGRGVAYSLTLPFSTAESDFVLRPGFLALLLRLTETARSLGGVSRSDVGSRWQLDGFSEISVAHALRDDRLEPVELEELPNGVKRAVVELAGLYRLELDGNVAFRAASVVETEVDLRPRDVKSEMSTSDLGGVDATVDVSPYVALLLIALLLAELGLRLWSTRNRPATAQPP
jgi:hypothetical protein